MGEDKRYLSMLGPDFRSPAWPGHVEFAPTYEKSEPGPGWKRIDGVKRLDHNGMFVFSKVYRVRIGTYANGDAMYFVGEYVGNRRHVMDNNASPELVGSTWQIFLQADPDDDETLECYRMCDLEVVPGEGIVVVEANDYKPDTPDFLVYYGAKARPKPELGLSVTHPIHGGGEVVRLTGTGETWYADVEYAWVDVQKAPTEGVNVRRLVTPPGGDGHWVYGQVFEVVTLLQGAGRVLVQFENERKQLFGVEDFYRQFRHLVDTSSKTFYELFGLDGGPRKLTPRVRRLKRDVRTHNERIMGGNSRSSMALSALSARNTPDSGEFVRVAKGTRPWSPDMTREFRWHRERPLPPKNDDFAPLTGRKESKATKSRSGPGEARLRAARAKLALDGPKPEAKRAPVHARPQGDGEDRDLIDLNGSIVSF